MKKSDIKELPPYFDRYINLNEDIELSAAFEKSIQQIDAIDIGKYKRIGQNVYADVDCIEDRHKFQSKYRQMKSVCRKPKRVGN